MAIEFNESNFQTEVLQSGKPVVVDFWAPWCGPCQMVGPVIEELSEEMKDSVKIGKLNVDESPNIAGQFGVMSIPTILIFKNGNVINQIVGALPKADMQNKIESAINGN